MFVSFETLMMFSSYNDKVFLIWF